MLPAHELRQIALALRLVAVEPQLVHAQVGMRAVGESHRARGARDLLHADDVREVAESGAAEALRHGDAEQPLPAERRPQVARKLVAAIDLGGHGRDLTARQIAGGVADQLLFRTELEFHFDSLRGPAIPDIHPESVHMR